MADKIMEVKKISQTSRGDRYFKVYKRDSKDTPHTDAETISQHSQMKEAIETASNTKLNNLEAYVYWKYPESENECEIQAKEYEMPIEYSDCDLVDNTGGNGGNNGNPVQGDLGFTISGVTVSDTAIIVTASVARNNGVDNLVEADYTTNNGSAVAGEDYTAKSGKVTFQDGEGGTQDIQITLAGTGTVSGSSEDFTIDLSNPSNGATLNSNTQFVITITNTTTATGVPYFTAARRTETLSWLTETSPQYTELLDTWDGWMNQAAGSLYDPHLRWPDAAMPLILFGTGPTQSNGTWHDLVKLHFMWSINNFNYQNHDQTRTHMLHMILTYLCLKEYYDANYFTSTEETEIATAFDLWANNLTTENVEVADSDENIHRGAILMVLKRLVSGSTVTAAQSSFEDYEDLVLNRHLLDDGTAGGGLTNESSSYDANSVRLASQYLDMAEFYGETTITNNQKWFNDVAAACFGLWAPDESGTLLYHDYIGSANSSGGVYPAEWDEWFEKSNFRMANICGNGLLRTQGTPHHKALIYLLDSLTPNTTSSKIHFQYYQNLWFRNSNVDATPTSISAIENLPLVYNGGNRNRIIVKETKELDSGYFHYVGTQMYRADHQDSGCAFGFAHNSKWITHNSSQIGGSTKQNPYNTIYIENMTSSNPPDPLIPWYDGAQGPNLRQVGKPLTLGFLGQSANNEFVGLITQNHTRYHNDFTYNAQTEFLKQWTRDIFHEWSGLNIVFDRVRCDVTDIDDINKKYGTSHSSYNRSVMKLQRFTSMPTLNNGWYEYSQFGKDNFYKSVSPVGTFLVVDEKNDEPYASAGSSAIYPNNKIAHLRETVTGSSSTEDDHTFIGVLAFGDSGRQPPTTYGAFTSSSGNVSAVAVVDGSDTFIYCFNRDEADVSPITATETITFTGLTIPSGAKIRCAGWDDESTFNATASGSVLTIAAGSGDNPSNLIFEDTI